MKSVKSRGKARETRYELNPEVSGSIRNMIKMTLKSQPPLVEIEKKKQQIWEGKVPNLGY